MIKFFRAACSLAAFLALVVSAHAGDWTWTYSVELHAAVQVDPPRVTLQWPTDQVPATGYTLRRKLPDERTWGPAIPLPANATSFVDDDVALGGAYEYQIEKESALYSAWGYLAVGVNAALTESRGKAILVVDGSVAGALEGELRRLQQDLVGDGWGVIRKDVGRGDRPEDVRNLIRAEWLADPANVRAVFLLGHVPVPFAGPINPDGHGRRAFPADVYYGDIDGNWTDADGDGVFEQGGAPSEVELAVGRVDFADLPGAYAPAPFPSEIELLRRYLDKDHAFRSTAVRPAARALVGNVVGDGRGQASAASAYRTFAALVGPENIVESGTDATVPLAERWITKLAANDYLWAYASGAGSDYSLGILGTHGAFNDVWGSDLLDARAKATFYLFFGSWISEWTNQDNLMRTALAAPDYGLTAVWSGRPHFYFQHFGLDRPIGESVRLSQNNDGLRYRNQVQSFVRSVHLALMGDPTLRLNYVAPPRDVSATSNGSDVVVAWNPSPDSVFGYRVYRSAAAGAAFERISGDLVNDTRWVDRPPTPADATYMVRAVTLQLGPSGSVYNASEGAFSRGDFALPRDAPAPLAAEPAIGKIDGAATEVDSDIRHPNGNVYDQVLLQGTMASARADPGQVLRMSWLDPDGDIVQAELSGAGTLSVLLEESSGPMLPEKYNQDVAYMRGRAGIAITGADATTHVAIFSVGRANAVNQGLFRDVNYDGVADIAFLTIASLDARFGAVRTGNVRFSASKGLTGLYASDIRFGGAVVIGDIDATGGATPVISLGPTTADEPANEVIIAGGDLAQSNGRAVTIGGVAKIDFTAGTNSQGVSLPAQSNRARIERNGVDVTAQVVANPQ